MNVIPLTQRPFDADLFRPVDVDSSDWQSDLGESLKRAERVVVSKCELADLRQFEPALDQSCYAVKPLRSDPDQGAQVYFDPIYQGTITQKSFQSHYPFLVCSDKRGVLSQHLTNELAESDLNAQLLRDVRDRTTDDLPYIRFWNQGQWAIDAKTYGFHPCIQPRP